MYNKLKCIHFCNTASTGPFYGHLVSSTQVEVMQWGTCQGTLSGTNEDQSSKFSFGDRQR
jgi:hypothetical protein